MKMKLWFYNALSGSVCNIITPDVHVGVDFIHNNPLSLCSTKLFEDLFSLNYDIYIQKLRRKSHI